MSDPHKYERAIDRQILPSDLKQRIIDLMENRFVAPEVAWDSEPVRYFKLNEQWCKILAGMLDWLEDPAAWYEAIDDNYPGIQGFLAFEVGIEPPGLPTEGDCLAYAPSASFIDYLPQNPFNNPDYIPPDYLMPPFMENDDLEYPEIFGYQASDVFVPFGAINIDPIDLVTFNLPVIQIHVKGAGQVEIDLLAVSFGGIAILKVGSMPNVADIILDNVIDTGIQIFDLEMPPSTLIHAGNILRSTEVNIEAEPDAITTIYIVFAPKLNDSIIPVAFGGGFRALQLCGFEGTAATMVYEDTRFNGATCSFEKRIDGTWSVIDGNEFWLDCVRSMMATQEEVKQAIIDAAKDIASMVLSGSVDFEGLCVDEDGTISLPSKPPKLPEDDEETPGFDESAAAAAGGAKAVTAGYNSIWYDMNLWKTNGISEDDASYRLQQKYQMKSDALTDTFVSNYYLQYPTSHISSYTEALSEMLYCQGGNFKNVVAEYIIDFIVDLGLQLTGFNLNDALDDIQITQWYERGASVPSTEYKGYNCTPIPDEELTFDMSLAEFIELTTAGIWKDGHRFLIRVTGTYTDTGVADVINDGMYSHNTATGVKTFNSMLFNSAGAVDTPVQADVPFEPSHEYEFTVDKNPGSADGTCIVRVNNTPFNLPGVSGILTVTIKDLGQFAMP